MTEYLELAYSNIFDADSRNKVKILNEIRTNNECIEISKLYSSYSSSLEAAIPFMKLLSTNASHLSKLLNMPMLAYDGKEFLELQFVNCSNLRADSPDLHVESSPENTPKLARTNSVVKEFTPGRISPKGSFADIIKLANLKIDDDCAKIVKDAIKSPDDSPKTVRNTRKKIIKHKPIINDKSDDKSVDDKSINDDKSTNDDRSATDDKSSKQAEQLDILLSNAPQSASPVSWGDTPEDD